MRVTVYILHHNQWKYLDQAVQSVFDQTYDNIEIILVDNNSKDADVFLPDFVGRFKFDKVLHRSDSNLKRAANEVLAVSTGEYVLRLDADDYFHESAVQIMVDKAKAKTTDFVSTDYFMVNDVGETIGQFYKNSIIDFAKRPDVPMHGACCLIRTDFLRASGGYNVGVLMQDGYDVWLALSGIARGEHINLPLFSYRRHSKNISNDSDKLIDARRNILASYCPNLPRYTLSYFTRAPLQVALVAAKELVCIIAQTDALSPNEVVVFCRGEHNSVTQVDLPSGQITVVERSDPEALEKNAVTQCLMDFEATHHTSTPFFACIYQKAALNFPILAGALRSAVTFEADVVHSVRRETMNLYYHDGVGLKPLSDNVMFTNERSIVFKRYPVCDVYRSIRLQNGYSDPKIGHFLLKSDETAVEVNHEWDVA